MRNLPPLNALKAFEACARHSNFTQAADELQVTQGAISRHVKTLEDYLGVSLFFRHARRAELTESGEALVPLLTEFLDRISLATTRIQAQATDLFVKLQPTFAVRWLIPRLNDFHERRPDINLRFTTSWRPVNFAKENFEVGIVCGSMIEGYDHTISCELILPEPLTPVCCPSLLREGPPLQSPSDLFRYTLLHSTDQTDLWQRWFAELDIPYKREFAVHHRHYDLLDTAIHAAVRGIGVALTNPQFIRDEIALGRLIMPFEDTVLDVNGYYFVCPKSMLTQSRVLAFRRWLIEVAKN